MIEEVGVIATVLVDPEGEGSDLANWLIESDSFDIEIVGLYDDGTVGINVWSFEKPIILDGDFVEDTPVDELDPEPTQEPHDYQVMLQGLNEYQDRTADTARGWAAPYDIVEDSAERGDMEGAFFRMMFLTLGIAGETGELAECIKKHVRSGGEYKYLDQARYELGDIMWYHARMAELLDFSLSYVAECNLKKLEDRDERDQIHGDGDDR